MCAVIIYDHCRLIIQSCIIDIRTAVIGSHTNSCSFHGNTIQLGAYLYRAHASSGLLENIDRHVYLCCEQLYTCSMPPGHLLQLTRKSNFHSDYTLRDIAIQALCVSALGTNFSCEQFSLVGTSMGRTLMNFINFCTHSLPL